MHKLAERLVLRVHEFLQRRMPPRSAGAAGRGMKSTKSKSAIQNDATDFLRATKRLLKVFTDNPPRSDEGYAHASSLRTLGRCVRGLENAKTDPELAAEMKLSMELLHDLEIIGYHAAEDQILLDEPDLNGDMARARDLMELIEELEAICTRERE